MPRGSNSEVELARVKRSEHTDFSENKKGAGARKNKELPAFHGQQKNSKNPPAPGHKRWQPRNDPRYFGNPWVIAYTSDISGGGVALPAVVVGPQNNSNQQAFPIMVRRWRWVSNSAAQGDQVIIQDVPGTYGSAGSPRTVYDSGAATGADFSPDEQRPAAMELFVGMQVTQFDSGILYIYI